MSNKAPNQRAITIQKQQSDKKHLYAIINLAAMSEAARTLTSLAGIKLWLYLDKNQDNYRIEAFSAQGFCEWANVSRAAYNTAFEELRDKGYLKLNEGTKTVFTFYEKPKQEESVNKHVELIKDNNIKENIEQIKVTDNSAQDLAADAVKPSQAPIPEAKNIKEITKRIWEVDESVLFDFSAETI